MKSKKNNYLVWQYENEPGACVLDKLEKAPSGAKISSGKPQMELFPTNAYFRMYEDAPKDTKLLDSIETIGRFIVVSPKIKKELEKLSLSKVELLPVAIRDHRGKTVARDYAIVNPIEPVDCVDRKKSKLTWDEFDKNYIETIEKLVIDEKKIPKDRMLFRLDHKSWIILVHERIAEKIMELKPTGVKFTKIEEFTVD